MEIPEGVARELQHAVIRRFRALDMADVELEDLRSRLQFRQAERDVAYLEFVDFVAFVESLGVEIPEEVSA